MPGPGDNGELHYGINWFTAKVGQQLQPELLAVSLQFWHLFPGCATPINLPEGILKLSVTVLFLFWNISLFLIQNLSFQRLREAEDWLSLFIFLPVFSLFFLLCLLLSPSFAVWAGSQDSKEGRCWSGEGEGVGKGKGGLGDVFWGSQQEAGGLIKSINSSS